MQYNIMPAASLLRSDWFISAISEQGGKADSAILKKNRLSNAGQQLWIDGKGFGFNSHLLNIAEEARPHVEFM